MKIVHMLIKSTASN